MNSFTFPIVGVNRYEKEQDFFKVIAIATVASATIVSDTTSHSPTVGGRKLKRRWMTGESDMTSRSPTVGEAVKQDITDDG